MQGACRFAGRFTRTRPTPGASSEAGLVIYRFEVGLFYANAERLSEEVLGLVDVPHPPNMFNVIVRLGADGRVLEEEIGR